MFNEVLCTDDNALFQIEIFKNRCAFLCVGDDKEKEKWKERKGVGGEKESSRHSRRCYRNKKGPCLHAAFVLIQGAHKQIDLCFSLCGKKSSDVPIRAKDELGKRRKDR